MAKLDLMPDLEVMTIQAVLFGASYFVVKSQFVAPYLKLKDKRNSLTSGSQSDAKAIVTECEQKALKIESAISKVIDETKVYRANEKETATKKQTEIVGIANKEAKAEIETISASISAMFKEEQAKIPEVVKSLTDDLYKMTLN